MENISAGTIDLSLTTGNVSAAGMNCTGDFAINLTTGKVALSDINCRNLIARSTTGEPIAAHTRVQVDKIEGVKVFVSPVEIPETV